MDCMKETLKPLTNQRRARDPQGVEEGRGEWWIFAEQRKQKQGRFQLEIQGKVLNEPVKKC